MSGCVKSGVPLLFLLSNPRYEDNLMFLMKVTFINKSSPMACLTKYQGQSWGKLSSWECFHLAISQHGFLHHIAILGCSHSHCLCIILSASSWSHLSVLLFLSICHLNRDEGEHAALTFPAAWQCTKHVLPYLHSLE